MREKYSKKISDFNRQETRDYKKDFKWFLWKVKKNENTKFSNLDTER